MAKADNTAGKQLVPFEFKPGQSGNPKGRPKGSRNKLNEAFLQDMYEAWQAFGRPALLATAWTEPATFVKVAAGLLPKEFKVETSIADMTDDERRSRIRELSEQLGLGIGAVGASGVRSRGRKAEGYQGKPH